MSTKVYILDFGNRIKIGRTKNIEQRIRTIENAAGEKAKQVFYLETDGIKEKLLHHYLQEHRTIGEYFTCSFDIAKTALENIASEPTPIKNNVKKEPITKEKYEDIEYIQSIMKNVHVIIKCNNFVRNAKYNFSLQEQKIFLYILSKTRTTRDGFLPLEFEAQDFFNVCHIFGKPGCNQRQLKEYIRNLSNKKIFMQLNGGQEIMFNCIEKPIVNNDTINVKISSDLKPYILCSGKCLSSVDEWGISYCVSEIIPMQSKYSIKLYEILKTYQVAGKCEWEIDRLKILLDAENYTSGCFKESVISVAMKEINAHGDISVSYEFERCGRNYHWIKFSIATKPLMDLWLLSNPAKQELI